VKNHSLTIGLSILTSSSLVLGFSFSSIIALSQEIQKFKKIV
jgi:hypothetical protein